MRELTNVEYEESYIGSILLDNSIIETIEIPVDCITSEHRQFIYKTILQMVRAGKQANIKTVIETCRAEVAKQIPTMWHDFINGGWMATELTQIPSSSNASFYAEALIELSMLRKVHAISKMIDESIYNPSVSAEQICTSIDTLLTNVKANKTAGYKRIGDALPAVIDKIELAYKNKGALTGVPSGFPTLDAMTNGFQGKCVYIIGARPGTGKTSISLNMAEAAFLSGKRAGFISCEMDIEMLCERMLSAMTAIDKRKFDSGYLTSADLQDIRVQSELLHEAGVYVDDTSNIRWADLVHSTKRMIRAEGIQILFIDYIGLISGITDNDKLPRNEQVKLVSKNIKNLARETGLPIVVLSQLAREAHGNRPNAAQLRESGSVEEDADAVFLLWDRGWNDESAKDYRSSTLIVEKHRIGPTGEVPLLFKPSTTRFREVDDDGKIITASRQNRPYKAAGAPPFNSAPKSGKSMAAGDSEEELEIF